MTLAEVCLCSQRLSTDVSTDDLHSYRSAGQETAIVRARKAERAEEAAATSGGMQLGAAAPEDDRRGDTASDAGRGGTSIPCSLAAYLGHERPE